LKLIYKQIQVILFLKILTKFQSDAQKKEKKVITILPMSPVWNVIQESAKALHALDHISENIARQALKFRPKVKNDFGSNGFPF